VRGRGPPHTDQGDHTHTNAAIYEQDEQQAEDMMAMVNTKAIVKHHRKPMVTRLYRE